MKKLSIGLVALTLALAGCGGGGDKTEAAKSDAGGGVAAAGGATTGVAECDDYMNKVMACINDKVPEAGRAAAKTAIDQTKKSWDAITDKAALANACKMAMDQAKGAYSAMGCTF